MVALDDPHTGWRQFARFAVVGLVSNGVLFLLYLALVSTGLLPPAAMTVSYVVGVLQTFAFNRSWTFAGDRKARGAPLRYVASYALGYVVNLFLLWALVGKMQMPHALVQGILILVIAVLIFLLQKYWVFRPDQSQSRDARRHRQHFDTK